MKTNSILCFAFPAIVTDCAFLPGTAFAQRDAQFSVSMEKKDTETALNQETLAQIIFFNAKKLEGKTYLNWNVTNLKQNGVFIIYASHDGERFDAIGSKAAIGVPIKAPVAYYFTDASSSGEKKYYRVLYVGSASQYLMSERVRTGKEDMAATKLIPHADQKDALQQTIEQ